LPAAGLLSTAGPLPAGLLSTAGLRLVPRATAASTSVTCKDAAVRCSARATASRRSSAAGSHRTASRTARVRAADPTGGSNRRSGRLLDSPGLAFPDSLPDSWCQPDSQLDCAPHPDSLASSAPPHSASRASSTPAPPPSSCCARLSPSPGRTPSFFLSLSATPATAGPATAGPAASTPARSPGAAASPGAEGSPEAVASLRACRLARRSGPDGNPGSLREPMDAAAVPVGTGGSGGSPGGASCRAHAHSRSSLANFKLPSAPSKPGESVPSEPGGRVPSEPALASASVTAARSRTATAATAKVSGPTSTGMPEPSEGVCGERDERPGLHASASKSASSNTKYPDSPSSLPDLSGSSRTLSGSTMDSPVSIGLAPDSGSGAGIREGPALSRTAAAGGSPAGSPVGSPGGSPIGSSGGSPGGSPGGGPVEARRRVGGACAHATRAQSHRRLNDL